jgi:agmatine deiminase
MSDGLVMPAEWPAHKRTWMCWPCREEPWSGAAGMARAKRAFADVAQVISAFEPVALAVRPEDAEEAGRATAGKADLFEVPLDDSWARDTGPTFLRGPEGLAAVQWRFNAWGGKYESFSEDAKLAARIAAKEGARLVEAPLVCEGGAIHSDGEGTLIATEQTLCNPNRNPDLSRADIERVLLGQLGAKKLIWLGEGFSDLETDGHVDNTACFVAPGKVLVGVPPFEALPDWEPVQESIRRLRAARDGMGRAFDIVEIEQPLRERFDGRGRPLAASYVNFAFVNGGIVLPAFDDPADDAALTVLRHLFPARKVVQLDARAIVEGGGGIHCITCQEPAI